MLVLTRKPGESIQIADNITLTVVRTHTNRVKLSVIAPASISVRRPELQAARKDFAASDVNITVNGVNERTDSAAAAGDRSEAQHCASA